MVYRVYIIGLQKIRKILPLTLKKIIKSAKNVLSIALKSTVWYREQFCCVSYARAIVLHGLKQKRGSKYVNGEKIGENGHFSDFRFFFNFWQ